MNPFDRLKKTPPQQSTEPSRDPNLIRVYDKYGQEMYISKEEWRKNVLPGTLKANWNNPDNLYHDIVMSLQDGFASDMLSASKQLFSIDQNKERAYCLYAIVLMENKKLDEAERVLREYLNRFGKSGYILNNLAKVFSKRGIQQESERLLLESLEVEPNQDNALGWWGVIHQERGGESAYIQSMQQIAQVQGSWRPQLWLARKALEANDLAMAMNYYEHALSIAKDIPDALMMISGDLGNHGHASEIIRLFAGSYEPERHGVETGYNLLQAYLQLKNHDDGLTLLNRMFAIKRPDVQNVLRQFATEFDKIAGQNQYGSIASCIPLNFQFSTLVKPIWYYNLGDPQWLISDKPKDAPTIAILTFANLTKHDSNVITGQREDTLGRLTRSVPLFLGEQLCLKTNANPLVLIPTLADLRGFVVLGGEWSSDQLAAFAKQIESRYAVSGYISQEADNLRLGLNFWDASSQSKIGSWDVVTVPEQIESAINRLSDSLFKDLEKKQISGNVKQQNFYSVPMGQQFERYLAALGQSLGLSMVVNGRMSVESLYGIRDMLDYFLQLAVHNPDTQVPKIMFLSGLCKNRAFKSEIYKEYQDKALNLLEDEKDKASAFYRLSPLLFRLFDDRDKFEQRANELLANANEKFSQWLTNLNTLEWLE